MPEVLAKARELVLQELDKPGSVEPTLLNVLVPLAALEGNAALYDRYLARAKSASDPEEQYRYLYALASFTDPALVRRTIDFILGPEVRPQDAKLFVASLLAVERLAGSRLGIDPQALERAAEEDRGIRRQHGHRQRAGRVLRRDDGRGNPVLFRDEQGAGRGTDAAAVARTDRVLLQFVDRPAPETGRLARLAPLRWGSRQRSGVRSFLARSVLFLRQNLPIAKAYPLM